MVGWLVGRLYLLEKRFFFWKKKVRGGGSGRHRSFFLFFGGFVLVPNGRAVEDWFQFWFGQSFGHFWAELFKILGDLGCTGHFFRKSLKQSGIMTCTIEAMLLGWNGAQGFTICLVKRVRFHWCLGSMYGTKIVLDSYEMGVSWTNNRWLRKTGFYNSVLLHYFSLSWSSHHIWLVVEM